MLGVRGAGEGAGEGVKGMEIPKVGEGGTARVPIWKVLDEMGMWTSEKTRMKCSRRMRGRVVPVEQREKTSLKLREYHGRATRGRRG